MSDTRTRTAVAVEDTAVLHYGDEQTTGTVTEVVRFQHGPRTGRVWKIFVKPSGTEVLVWFVPARDGDYWKSGGEVTATF